MIPFQARVALYHISFVGALAYTVQILAFFIKHLTVFVGHYCLRLEAEGLEVLSLFFRQIGRQMFQKRPV